MGTSQFKIPKDVREQWVELNKNGKKLVQNLITLELFQFLVLSTLKEQQNISKLIERSIYSIPKSPKIIILNDQQGELFLLVQQFQGSLTQHLQKQRLLTDVLVLLEKIAIVMKSLVKKYGPFHIRDEMIGLNSNQEIIVWINELRYKNIPSFPIDQVDKGQAIMICQLLQIFKKHSKVFLFREKQLKQLRSLNDFQKVLNKMIQQQKEQMVSYSKQQLSKEKVMRKRLLSPQTSFGQQKMKLILTSNFKDPSIKAEKRNQVPKFVKNLKEKKNHLLDSLHHKRTLTIEEPETVLSGIKKNNGQNNSTRLANPSKSLGRKRSPQNVSLKDKSFNNNRRNSSKHLQIHTSENCQILTSSGSSNNCGINRREFTFLNAIKSCGDLIQDNEVISVKPNSQSNTPNTPEQSSNYWQANTNSTLFQSFQKSAPIPQVSSNVSLGQYAGIIVESRHFDGRNSEVIVEEESQYVSKTIEEEFNDMFPSGSRSPRLILGVMNESVQLAKQFGKIIDF